MAGDRGNVLIRESAADVIIQSHIEAGGFTGQHFAQVTFGILNQANQEDVQAFLTAENFDLIVKGFWGFSFKVTTAGNYTGRWVSVDSEPILDLSLTTAPGAAYYQLDGELIVTDADGTLLTGRSEGIPTPMLTRLRDPLMFEDPLIIPVGKKATFTLKINRNPGIDGTAYLSLLTTRLYGARSSVK